MEKLVRGIDILNVWMARISGIILGIMVILILTEIFLWNTVQVTTLIADEYSAYGLAIIIFLGAGYTLKEKAHIRITLIVDRLPLKIANVLILVTATFTTAFMGYLWYYLYKMMFSSYRYGSTSGTLTETLLWIPQAFLVIGASAFTLQLLAEIIRAFQGLKSQN